jgi:hypothetical protein
MHNSEKTSKHCNHLVNVISLRLSHSDHIKRIQLYNAFVIYIGVVQTWRSIQNFWAEV